MEPRRHGRDPAIDALRGAGILAVVLSHLASGAVVAPNAEPVRMSIVIALYLCNVQVLAFASGLVAGRARLRDRMNSLLVPLGCWLALEIAASPLRFTEALQESVKGVATGHSQYWFLWAIFVCLVVLGPPTRWPVLVLACIALVLATVWPFIPAASLFRGFALLFPFVALAAMWRRISPAVTDRVERAWPALLLGFLLFAAAVAWHLKTPVWIGYSMSPKEIPVQLGATFGSALACIGLLGAARFLKGQLLSATALLGTASLGIYGVHGIVLAIFPRLGASSSLVEMLAAWIVLVSVSLALTLLIGRSRPLKALLLGGRSPRRGYPTAAPTVPVLESDRDDSF